MIRVKKDWWKEVFDEIYLITDARSVCNKKITSREVDFLEKTLKLKKKDRILDLCGGNGRHSFELAKRGYRNLVLLDYSKFLVNLGRKEASKEKLKIKFYRRDARSTGLEDRYYDVIAMMGNSFGYFLTEKENLKILKEAKRILKEGGKLLLDIIDGKCLRKNFKRFSWHNANNDISVLRKREIDKKFVRSKELVFFKEKRLIRNNSYCETIYDENEITKLLKKAGFTRIKVMKGLSFYKRKGDYGFMSSRIIVISKKPA